MLNLCVEHARVEKNHDFVHDAERLGDQVEIVLEFVHNLLDLVLTIDLDLEVVARIGQIRRHHQEPLIDLIKRDGHFKLLMGSLPILFVFSDRDGHLPDEVGLIGKFDVGRWPLLLCSSRTPLLLLMLLWVFGAPRWLSAGTTAPFVRLFGASPGGRSTESGIGGIILIVIFESLVVRGDGHSVGQEWHELVRGLARFLTWGQLLPLT